MIYVNKYKYFKKYIRRDGGRWDSDVDYSEKIKGY